MRGDTNIIGYIRFSYFGRSDARLSRSDKSELLSKLYDEERMNERFYLFESICLPSLRWQSDQDFKIVVLISPEMPDVFKERLAKSVADIPQVEILCVSAEHVTFALNPWIEKQAVVQNHRTAHFRLDDDDAIASHFIENIRATMGGVPDHTLISLPSGLYLTNDGGEVQLLAKFQPYIAIGLTIINPPGHIANPYQMSHSQYYRNVPSLMLPNEFAYIHTAHGQSDTLSVQGKRRQQHEEYHAETWANKPRRFKMAVRRNFGGHGIDHFLKILQRAPSTEAVRP